MREKAFTDVGFAQQTRERSRIRFNSGSKYLLALAITLGACEAPLDLSGVTAQLSRSTQRSDMFQAAARNQDSVIFVGNMGTVVQSEDAGDSWQRLSLPGKPFLLDVVVCADGRFHAIENTDGIWSRQTDGNWTRQALPEMTEPQSLTCDAENALWVTGGFSTIIHSVDGGASWDSWSLDEDLYLTTIQFLDRLNGVVTGEFGTVLLTTDGGLEWVRANDLPDSFYPQSAYFTNPATGWVVGLNGTIWKTENGSQSWQQAQNGFKTPLYGITGFGNTLLAVGDNTTILFNRTGEATWTPLAGTTKSRTYLRAAVGIGDSQFIVAGGGTLFTVTVPVNSALTSTENPSMESSDE